MNIIVKTSAGRITVRPDTTWEKDNEDFYPPEFVEEVTFTPVLFARILKPGRSVGKKFASRYYDNIGFGILLFPENLIDGSNEGYAQALCLDHTSFLPTPTYSRARLNEDRGFHLRLGPKDIFTYPCNLTEASGTDSPDMPAHAAAATTNVASPNMIEETIAEATKLIYIRTGDLIAIELSARMPLAKRKDGRVRIQGTFGQDKILDFQIIF